MMLLLTDLFIWIIKTSVMASVLVLFIFIAKILLKDKLKPNWSYLLWILLVLRLIVPWTPESSFSVFNILPFEKQESIKVQGDTFEPIEPAAINSLVTAGQPTDSDLHDDNESDAPVNKTDEASISISTMHILSLIWLIGSLSLLGFILVTNIRLAVKLNKEPSIEDQAIRAVFEQCKNKMKIKRSIGLVETSHVSGPTLFGTIRPKIVLPRSVINALDVSQLRYVFLHEMSHIKRNDIAVNWLMNILLTLHWFNPLLWYAYRKMRNDQEIACDSLALTSINQEETKDYALTIIRLLESFSNPIRLVGAAGISSNKKELKRRVFMIASFKKNSYKWSLLGLMVMLLISGCTLTNPKSNDNSKETNTSPAPAHADIQKYEDGSELKSRLMDDRKIIAELLISEYSSIYAGTYSEDNGDNVFLLTELSVEIEEKVKAKSKFADKIKFKQVKYTKAKLLEAHEKLSSLAVTLGLEAVGLNGKENKVNVYISEDGFQNNKQEVLKYIDEDMVNWIIGTIEIQDLLATTQVKSFDEKEAVAMVLKDHPEFPKVIGQVVHIESQTGGPAPGLKVDGELRTMVEKSTEKDKYIVTLTKAWNLKVNDKEAKSVWTYEVTPNKVELISSEENADLVQIIK